MKKDYWILFLFVVAKFVLQYSLIAPEYELQRDEYLHLDQGYHLAFGYLSVPPVTSWFAWLIRILGGSVFWVKFFPALFGALTMVVVWKIIEELKGSLFAKVLASLGILFSILLRLNTLFQPNSLEVLLWTLFFYILIKYINTEKVKWLYWAGIIFGFGVLNKYNIAFLALGFIPALLISDQRRIFSNKHVYGAAFLTLIIVLPNLIWQYNNHFPVVHHMKELSERQLVNVNRFDFLKSQALFFIGVAFVIVAGLYALLFDSSFKKYRFFFWGYLMTIALFMYFRAKDYYAIGLYPVYVAFGAAYLGVLLDKGWKRFLKPICILHPVILFIPQYNLLFPNKSPEFIVSHQDQYKKYGLLRWEDGKDHPIHQDFADMLGWKELAQKVDKEYSGLSKTGNTLVLCDNYGQAGAINYYSKLGIKAVSFNADYINWFDLSKKYKNLIRVKDRPEDELEKTGAFFKKSLLVGSVTNPFARENGTVIFGFKEAKIDIRNRLEDEIKEIKWRINR
ncbi:glycosyl transferase [Chryseobacterium lactis]|uniref:Glycosyl transferase n=1 Tax=Chryseobacterium lactis TaxID=1241981 RepID=A0A3G6RV69_CHRLC|nr:glycosyltransferase family 39 protein [Chryseobacterium lactis]AZA80418.1 glycosyl transferase [Chryseobacterium lactis]AZB05420.1 glycosyl transferase [Chryseobacterium lactis]PNW11569.1 glycosyl transferase [Chryseobacterium lactis]